MENISKHITLAEATKSQVAIRRNIANVPGSSEIANMKLVAEKCFEPLRNHFKMPIGISSFYRCKLINQLVGGSITSQHVRGLAIDIDADIFGGITNKEIFDWLKENVDFDQLIWEYGTDLNPAWVHISYISPQTNRKQILRIK
jgi:zinc D-Ala-D-Ala carboxypeptidase